VGDRIPGIWFCSNTTKMHICTAMKGNRNHYYNTQSLIQRQWSTVEITQFRQELKIETFQKSKLIVRTLVEIQNIGQIPSGREF